MRAPSAAVAVAPVVSVSRATIARPPRLTIKARLRLPGATRSAIRMAIATSTPPANGAIVMRSLLVMPEPAGARSRGAALDGCQRAALLVTARGPAGPEREEACGDDGHHDADPDPDQQWVDRDRRAGARVVE